MDTFYHILKLSAGIGLFLFAMYLLEESLKKSFWKELQALLQRITKNKIGAVTGGLS
jgi:phosphate:Na+ symporter